ncbi:hypothetical protein ACHAWF_014785, partial [Thalassiosira exigua]
MIVLSVVSRFAFLHSAATSAISSSIAIISADSDRAGGHLYTNARNAPLSFLESTSNDPDARWKISSSLVRKATSSYLAGDPSLAGPLLRLAFHDAATMERDGDGSDSFTGGTNGSVRYELGWSENRGLSRPLAVVEGLHADVGESLGLSFADCVALAGAQSVEFAGGPRIPVRLGRKDADRADERKRRKPLRMATDRSAVETTLPSAGLDSDGLRLYFGALGLSEMEFVALCGAHDLGRHVTLLDMPKSCLKDLTRECLENAPVLMPFVAEEPDRFSNTYFKKLLKWNERRVSLGEVAFIPTDVDLVVDEGLRGYVQQFARDEDLFCTTFAVAFQKLVDAGARS